MKIGALVHYVAYGTPGGEYPNTCRAAYVTAVPPEQSEGGECLSLVVLNPTGMFFNPHIEYGDTGGAPGDPDCPNRPHEGGPMRYCACGWSEPFVKGGTWHPAVECPTRA